MFSSARRLLSLRIKVSAMKNSSIMCITNATMIALLLCTARSFAPASVKSYQKELSGVTFTLDRGLMEIRICRADIIEVRYTSLQDFVQRTSLVVVNRWETPTRYGVTERSGRVVISTDRLIISVDTLTDAIKYAEKNGTVVLAEAAPSGKSMNAATVAGIQTYRCSTTFLSPPDEALFGLGCHPEDSLAMNYKGRDQDLAIRYMTGAIPVLLSYQRIRPSVGQLLRIEVLRRSGEFYEVPVCVGKRYHGRLLFLLWAGFRPGDSTISRDDGSGTAGPQMGSRPVSVTGSLQEPGGGPFRDEQVPEQEHPR